MSKTLAAFLIALVFLLTTPRALVAAPQAAPTAYEVIAAVNMLRASHGLPPYLVDPILMMAAQGQADYLASTPGFADGHTGPGGTDSDARAHALGYPEVPGLDINENWGTLREGDPIETLIYGGWSDEQHMHTMLHERGQHVGAGVSVRDGRAYIILDVAAFWGDAGLTAQPTSTGLGGGAAGEFSVSQYIAPVILATAAPDGSITHLVMPGQSLWMIAHHYQTDIETLQALNALGTSETLQIGQKILVRAPAPVKTASLPTWTSPPQVLGTPTPDQSTPETPAQTPSQAARTATFILQSPQDDASGWFLAFFGLFGVGVILIIISLSTNR